MKKISSFAIALSLISLGGAVSSVPLLLKEGQKVLAADYGDVGGGNGTTGITIPIVNGVYQISSLEQLAKVSADILNGQGADYSYELINDIDLNGGLWTPIGTSSNPFTGCFNGNGYKIYGSIMIDSSVIDNFGIFGNVGTSTNSAQIVDLIIDNNFQYTVDDTKKCGTLAGSVINSVIAGVYDHSDISGVSTIGEISGNSKIYRGGYSLKEGQTIEETITVKESIPASVTQGKVVTFDLGETEEERTGASFKNSSNKELITSTYKVLLEGNTSVDVGLNLDSFGTVFPNTTNAKVFAKKPGYMLNPDKKWSAGGQPVSSFSSSLIAANNYIINANWQKIEYTLNFYKGAIGEASSPLGSKIYYVGDVWEDVIKDILALNVAAEDLINIQSTCKSDVVTQYSVSVTYDNSGNRYINSVKDTLNLGYLADALANTMVDFGEESVSVDVYSVWQAQDINVSINYSTNSGADFSTVSETLVDNNGTTVELGNIVNNKRSITTRPGRSFTYTITVPVGYQSPVVKVKGTGFEGEVNIDPTTVSGRTYTFDIPSFADTSNSINITLERKPFEFSIKGDNISIELIDASSWTNYLNGRVSTKARESFKVKVTPLDGYVIASYGMTENAFTPDPNYDIKRMTGDLIKQLIVSFSDINNVISGAELNIVTKAKVYDVNVGYKCSDDYNASLSQVKKPEMTLVAGGESKKVSQDTKLSGISLGNGTGKISISDNQYYVVTAVKFGGIALSKGEDGYYSYSGVEVSGSYVLDIVLTKKEYALNLSFKGEYSSNVFTTIKNASGQDVSASGIAVLNGSASASSGAPSLSSDIDKQISFYYGQKLNLNLSVVSSFYEFGGWYYSNGEFIGVSEYLSIDTASWGTMSDKTIYATIKEKKYTVTVVTNATILDKDGKGSDVLNAITNYLGGISINGVSGKTSFIYEFGYTSGFTGINYTASSDFYNFDGWYVNGVKYGTVEKPTTLQGLLGENIFENDGLFASNSTIEVRIGVKQKTREIKFVGYEFEDKDGTKYPLGTFTTDTYTYYYNQSLVLSTLLQNNFVEPVGYELLNWQIDYNNDGNIDIAINNSEDLKNFINNVPVSDYIKVATFYPVYRAKGHTIYFYDTYTSELNNTLISQIDITYDSEWSITEKGIRRGYTINQWQDVEFSANVFDKGYKGIYKFDRDLILKVKEDTLTKDVLVFDINVNGGNTISETSIDMQIGDNFIEELSAVQSQLTRPGFKFAGWAVELNRNQEYIVFGCDESDISRQDGVYFNGHKLFRYVEKEGGKIFFNPQNFSNRSVVVEMMDNGVRYYATIKENLLKEYNQLINFAQTEITPNSDIFSYIKNNIGAVHVLDGETITLRNAEGTTKEITSSQDLTITDFYYDIFEIIDQSSSKERTLHALWVYDTGVTLSTNSKYTIKLSNYYDAELDLQGTLSLTDTNGNIAHTASDFYWQKKVDGVWTDISQTGYILSATSLNIEGTYRLKYTIEDKVDNSSIVLSNSNSAVIYSNEFVVEFIKTPLEIVKIQLVNIEDTVEYKSTRYYMNQVATFFKNNPQYDAEGVYTDYTATTSAGELFASLGLNINSATDSGKAQALSYLQAKAILTLIKIDDSFAKLLSTNNEIRTRLATFMSADIKSSLESIKSKTAFEANMGDIAKYISNSDGKILSENKNTQWSLFNRYVNVRGVSFEDIVVVSDVQKVDGQDYYQFTNVKSILDADVGYYNKSYWKLAFDESVAHEGYASYQEMVLSSINFEGNDDYAEGIYKVRTSLGKYEYYMVNIYTEQYNAIRENSIFKNSTLIYLDLEDNMIMESIHNQGSIIEIERTFNGAIEGEGNSSLVVTLRTNSTAVGNYSMLDENLQIVKLRINDGKGNVYTLIRSGNDFILDSSADNTLKDGRVDINKYSFWINGNLEVVARAFSQDLETHNIKAGSDYNSIQSATAGNETILVKEITAVLEGQERIIDISSITGAIYYTLGQNRYFLGEIVGNGTRLLRLNFTDKVTKYTYEVRGVASNAYYLGRFSTSTQNGEFKQVIKGFDTTNQPALTQQVEIASETGSKHIVISNALLVKLLSGWNDEEKEIYVNLNEPFDLQRVIDFTRDHYRISGFTTNATGTTIAGNEVTVANVEAVEITTLWIPTDLVVSGKTQENVTATEEEVSYNARDYITEVTGFQSDDYTCVWENGNSPVLKLNRVSQSGDYKIIVTHKVYTDAKGELVVTFTISQQEISIASVTGFNDFGYKNDNKLSGTKTITLSNGKVKTYPGDEFISFKATDSNGDVVTEIKNVGRYYLKINSIDGDIYRYSGDVNTSFYTIDITKYEYQLTEQEASFSKTFGNSDPEFTVIKNFFGEDVKITFVREQGEEVDTYKLTIVSVTVNGVDATNNYTITIPEDNKWFTIEAIPDTSLLVELDGELNMVFDGSTITTVVAEWTGNKWNLVVKAGSVEKARAQVSLYYFNNSVKTPVPTEENVLSTNFSFVIDSVRNVGVYNITISGSNETYVGEAKFILNGNTSSTSSFEITKKEISVSNISKEFDNTKNYNSNDALSNATFTGVVSGDEVSLSATYASAGTADEIANATSILLSGLTLNGTHAGNYYLASGDYYGTVIKNTTWARDIVLSIDKQFIYGDITSSNYDTNVIKEYLTIKSGSLNVKSFVTPTLTIRNESYSTGNFLKFGDYTVEVGFTSPYLTNFNSEYTFAIKVNKKEITLTISKTQKTYDTTTALPKGAVITIDYLTGDKVSCDVVYENANKGDNKNFVLTPSGDDVDNYIISCTQKGSITEKSYTINLDHSKFTFVADGENVSCDKNSITFNYTQDLTAEVAYGLLPIPTRKGYDFEGWYIDQSLSTELTTGNILEFLRDNTENEDVTVYSNWSIKRFSIKVVINADKGDYTITDPIAMDGEYSVYNYFSTIAMTVSANDNYVITGVKLQKEGETSYYELYNADGTVKDIVPEYITDLTKKYIVTVSFRDVNVSVKTISEGEEKNIIDNLPFGEAESVILSSVLTPKTNKTGYSISKWTYNKIVGDEEVEVVVSSDMTLRDAVLDILNNGAVADGSQFVFYAHWEANTYSVTFDDQCENTWVVDIVYDTKIGTGSGYKLPERNPGYRFKEWNIDRDGKGKGYNAESISDLLENSTLYAIWEEEYFELTINVDAPYEGVIHYNIETKVQDEWRAVAGTSPYQILSARDYRITANPKAGYEVEFTFTSEEKVVFEINPSNIAIIHDVFADITLKITITPRENTITIITEDCTEDIVVNGDTVSPVEEDNVYKILANTDTQAVISVTARAGYEVNYASSRLESGSAKLTASSSSLTVSEFTGDITIRISAVASSYSVTINISDKIDSIDVLEGGVKNNNSIQVTTDTTLKIRVNTIYGYVNPAVSNLSDPNVNITEIDPNQYIWEVKGFTEAFSFDIDAEPKDCEVVIQGILSIDKDYLEKVEDGHEVSLTQGGSSLTGNKAKFDSSVEYKVNKIAEGYLFEGWYSGYTKTEQNVVVLGTLVSEEQEYIHLVKGDISLVAVFRFTVIDMDIRVNGQGTLSYVVNNPQEEEEGVDSIFKSFVYGSELRITPVPNRGYLFDKWVDENGYDLVGNENLTIDSNNVLIIRVKEEVKAVAKFVAGTSSFEAEAELYINGIKKDHKNRDFAKIGQGTFDEITKTFTLIGEESISKEINYTTDIDTYIRIQTYSGYEFETLYSIIEGNEVVVAANKVYEYTQGTSKYYVYQLTNLNSEDDYSKLRVKINAKQSAITINFINEEGKIVDAGRFKVREDSFGVLVSGNYSSNVRVNAITGSTVELIAYARFNFTLPTSDYCQIVGGADLDILGRYDEEVSTGFTSSLNLKISNYSTDITLSIRVISEKYNVQLYNGSELIGEKVENIKIGDRLSFTNSLSAIENLANSRPGYELIGFFTAENAAGKQYVDSLGNALNAWEENGYIWNGESYVAGANYDPITKTFKLYAGWRRLKTAIRINSNPKGIQGIDPTVAAKVVISSINSTNSWLDVNDIFYVDMLFGADLVIKAPVFENYKFDSWAISLDGEEQAPIYTETYIKEGGFNNKEVTLVARYLAKVSIDSSNGGISSLSQGELTIDNGEEGYINPTKSFILTAVPTKGFSFKGWYNKDTGVIISDSETYTFTASEDNEFTPMNIEAVFEGNRVEIRIGDYDDSFGKVRKIVYKGEEKQNSFSAAVGDTLEIYVGIIRHQTKKYGVAWNLEGIKYYKYDWENSEEFDVMVYTYTISGEDVDENDEVIIIPAFTEKTITIQFVVSLNGETDYSKAGKVECKGMVDNKITISYGVQLVVNIEAFLNYKVSRITLDGRNILEYYNNNVLTIPSNLIGNMIGDISERTLNIVFAENLWLDNVLISTVIDGDGTKGNPFKIKTEEELAYVAYKINIENDQYYANASYILTNDISLVGKFWVPIGTEECKFNGVFNFAGYKIFGITLSSQYNIENTKYNGAFGAIGEKAMFIENNNAVTAVIVAASAGVGILAAILIIIFVLRHKKKKKLQELANN